LDIERTIHNYVEKIPVSALGWLAGKIAKKRDMDMKWPHWKCDAVEDDAESPFRKDLRKKVFETVMEKAPEMPVRVKSGEGHRYKLVLCDTTSRNMYNSGTYEPNEMAFLSEHLREGMTFLDIGACFGLYTVWAAAKVGPRGLVAAFEPSPREFRSLEENVRLNRLGNVRAFNIGISDSRKKCKLRISGLNESGQNTFGEFVYPGVTEIDNVLVQLESLDEVADRLGIGKIDVAKIDTEGHEYFVLQGMRKRLAGDRPVLLLELFDEALRGQGRSAEEVLELLDQSGYDVLAASEETGDFIKPKGKLDVSFSRNIAAIPR